MKTAALDLRTDADLRDDDIAAEREDYRRERDYEEEPDSSRPRRVPSPDCYHLAVQLPHGHLEPWWGDRGPVSLDVATRALEALMTDPPGDRDERLCVVSVPGKWHDAEIVLSAEEVLARAPRVARCPGCGSQGHDLCGGDHCENGDRA